MRRDDSAGDTDRDEAQEPAWDANDPRRQRDCFAPPTEPCECYCNHCERVFMSTAIWFQKINGRHGGLDGYWMCPTANCGGAGFTFDIFPTDPNHPANEGWVYFDDDEDECDEFEMDEDDELEYAELAGDDDDDETEYDPAEPHYQMMEQFAGGEEEDDLDGEEWKYGLAPGERPEPQKPAWLVEEEKKFDEPDRRPREIDWIEPEPSESGGKFNEDDIPF